MRGIRLPLLVTLVLTGALALRIADVWGHLPNTMASHFGASGAADAFMSKGAFFATMALFGGGSVAMVFAAPLVIAGGTITLALGVSDNITFGSPVPQLFVPGAVAMGAGFIGVTISGVAVADGRRAKREVERDWAQAEFLLGPAGVRVRFSF